MDWAGIISSEPSKEEEMSKLIAGFSTRMRKRATGSKGESTPIFDGKRLNWFSLDEEAQKDWVIILVDSPDRASND